MEEGRQRDLFPLPALDSALHNFDEAPVSRCVARRRFERPMLISGLLRAWPC